MSQKMCGVCRHDEPGHYPYCPVLTREVVESCLNQSYLNQKIALIQQQISQSQELQGGLSPMGSDPRHLDQDGNYPPQPETPESPFQRVVLFKLSAIQSDVARILEILTGEKPHDQLPTQQRQDR